MLEKSRLDCQTEQRHRCLQAAPPSVRPSAETTSPSHMTHCMHSRLSMGTWCSPLEVRGRHFAFTHLDSWPREQLCEDNLPQSFSSDPSTQSFCRSHLRSIWTHSPLSQGNCLWEHGLGTRGSWEVTGVAVVPSDTQKHKWAQREQEVS